MINCKYFKPIIIEVVDNQIFNLRTILVINKKIKYLASTREQKVVAARKEYPK